MKKNILFVIAMFSFNANAMKDGGGYLFEPIYGEQDPLNRMMFPDIIGLTQQSGENLTGLDEATEAVDAVLGSDLVDAVKKGDLPAIKYFLAAKGFDGGPLIDIDDVFDVDGKPVLQLAIEIRRNLLRQNLEKSLGCGGENPELKNQLDRNFLVVQALVNHYTQNKINIPEDLLPALRALGVLE